MTDQIFAPFSLHDLRRTGASTLARLGFDTIAIDKLLAHQPTKLWGVATIYQRYDFAEERARALDAWAEYVLTNKAGQLERPLETAMFVVVGADRTFIRNSRLRTSDPEGPVEAKPEALGGRASGARRNRPPNWAARRSARLRQALARKVSPFARRTQRRFGGGTIGISTAILRIRRASPAQVCGLCMRDVGGATEAQQAGARPWRTLLSSATP